MKKRYKINYRIRDPKVRVIDNNGDNLGVLDTKEAIIRAKKADLDLVLVAEKAKPPVAKILDFNKFLYDEKKKASQSKGKKSELKELRFGPLIGKGDLKTRINRAKEFIEDGDRVRLTVYMRGRERAHPELGIEKIEKIAQALENIAKLEKKPKIQGHQVMATLVKA